MYDTDWDPVAQQWRAGLCFTPPDLAFATRNNRLIEYREYGPEAGGSRPLERSVAYTYYATGLVSNIAIKDEYLGVGDPEDYKRYHGLTLYYRSNGMLWLAAWEDWEVNPQAGERLPRYCCRRWLVERTHSWLNRLRRLLIRREKKVGNCAGMLYLACACITFRAAEVMG